MRVELTAAAVANIEVMCTWWREHRPAAPALLEEELAAAFALLEQMQGVGTAYTRRPQYRRLLLPRTRYHLYFRVDQDASVVYVVSVWHAQRGSGPRL